MSTSSTRGLPLLVALLLSGCAVPSEEVGGAAQRISELPVDSGAYALDFVSNGQQRAYILYLPAGYDPNRVPAYPLVAMFHGLGGGAANFAGQMEEAGLRDLADDQGKIIVFFHGKVDSEVTELGGWWNLTTTGRDDVLFTEQVLDYLAGELNVDETRVFAGGHSMGGAFVHALGTRVPERFRAIADVSGFYGTTGGQPAPPPAGTLLPVLIVHGYDDPIVPYAGGVVVLPLIGPVNFLPTQDTYASWYDNNDCTEASNLLLGQFWTIELTDCRATESDPILYFVSVAGLAHNWPTEDDFYDASSEMLAFFDSH